MFEFFIALFGIIYFGAKFASEKSADKRYEAAKKITEDKRAVWLKEVTNKPLEDELRMYVYNTQNTQKILDDVLDFYDAVLEGKDFESLYPSWLWPKGKKYTRQYMASIVPYDKERALRILMAKKGYLPHYDALTGSLKQLSFGTPLDAEIFNLCIKELQKHSSLFDNYISPSPGWGAQVYCGWEI